MIDVTNPGAAFARQAAAEASILQAAEQMMRRFLAGVRAAAYSGMIFPPDVYTRWDREVDAMMDELPRETSDYLLPVFRDTGIPEDAYATAVAVLTTAAQTFASDSERRAAIDRAFDPDAFAPEQITASAYPYSTEYAERLEETGLVAAGFWDSLQESGSVWIKRVRRVTRTGATGLAGWTTITVLRIADYPMKRWVTRHDDRVRATHREANGQTVPTNQPFFVGGAALMYPGEREALYGEIANCRCALIGVNSKKGQRR